LVSIEGPLAPNEFAKDYCIIISLPENEQCEHSDANECRSVIMTAPKGHHETSFVERSLTDFTKK